MSAVSRVLFVDDEVRILEGLRGSLRRHRKTWDMEFAPGGDVALALLDTTRFDVVVTDLRMPKVDGVTLLRFLQERHPETVRIVLSGEPGKDLALKFMPYAHQALTKPCRVEELEAVLSRACRVRRIVTSEAVRRALGTVRDLPVLPKTYQRLTALLEDENAGVREVASVVSEDIAVSAKLLQCASSAFFGAGRQVRSIEDAVTMLGLETVKCLTLSAEVFGRQRLTPEQRSFAEKLHDHSLVVARIASELAEPAEKRDAFLAGLLHDIGHFVLATQAGCIDADGSAAASHVAHAHVGGYLLALWGLSLTVTDAVAGHHGTADASPSNVTHAVMAADAAAAELKTGLVASEDVALRARGLLEELRNGTKGPKASDDPYEVQS